MTIALKLDNLRLAYDTADGMHHVVDGFSLTLEQGEIGCLLGASGCGKTTVLRAVAGFEPVRAGQILLDGQIIATAAFHVAPEHRHVGMVFQDYALFPHLTAADNIAFGLRRWSRADRQARVAAMLELVGLDSAGKSYPHELSGGQQQRIALARALAPKPKLILLDEPFSNLDVDLRERLARDVRAILKASGQTGLLVTHNRPEAYALADYVGTMADGRMLQWDRVENSGQTER